MKDPKRAVLWLIAARELLTKVQFAEFLTWFMDRHDWDAGPVRIAKLLGKHRQNVDTSMKALEEKGFREKTGEFRQNASGSATPLYRLCTKIPLSPTLKRIKVKGGTLASLLEGDDPKSKSKAHQDGTEVHDSRGGSAQETQQNGARTLPNHNNSTNPESEEVSPRKTGHSASSGPNGPTSPRQEGVQRTSMCTITPELDKAMSILVDRLGNGARPDPEYWTRFFRAGGEESLLTEKIARVFKSDKVEWKRTNAYATLELCISEAHANYTWDYAPLRSGDPVPYLPRFENANRVEGDNEIYMHQRPSKEVMVLVRNLKQQKLCVLFIISRDEMVEIEKIEAPAPLLQKIRPRILKELGEQGLAAPREQTSGVRK